MSASLNSLLNGTPCPPAWRKNEGDVNDDARASIRAVDTILSASPCTCMDRAVMCAAWSAAAAPGSIGSKPEKRIANRTVSRRDGTSASASAAADAPCEKPRTPSNGPCDSTAAAMAAAASSQPRICRDCTGRTGADDEDVDDVDGSSSPSSAARAAATDADAFSPTSHHALGPTSSPAVPSADASSSPNAPDASCGASMKTKSIFFLSCFRMLPVRWRKVSPFCVKSVQAQHPQLTIGVAHLAGAHPHHRLRACSCAPTRVVASEEIFLIDKSQSSAELVVSRGWARWGDDGGRRDAGCARVR